MILHLVIQVHDMQDIHQLSLILVQTLDLYIKDRTRIHLDPVILLDILRQTQLILILDIHKLLLRLLIIGVDLHLRNLRQVRDPLIPDVIRHPVRQKLIAMQQETALRDTVRLIVKLPREHLIEVLQRLRLQDLRMKLRHAIDGISGHDRQIRHLHLTVIDDRHIRNLALVSRILLLHFDQETAVNLLHDLVDTRKKSREQLDRPFLQRFRHDGMIRVGNGLRRNLPRLVPLQAFLVQKDPHQLRNRDRRMRIIHLEGRFLIELVDIRMRSLIMLDRILHGSGDEEILLLQPQLLACIMVVIRIQDLNDIPCQVLLLHCLLVIALVERIQLEIIDRFRVPDPQGIDKVVVVADNRDIKRNRAHGLIVLLEELVPVCFVIILHAHVTAELNLFGILRPPELKRIPVLQPVIRNLNLETILDLLLEHPETIPDAAAVSRISQRRQGIQEACRQPAKASVSKRGIAFLILNRIQIHAQLFQRFLHVLVCRHVDQGVTQRTPHQKLHGHVVKNLRILLRHRLGRRHPVIDNDVLHGIGHCLKQFLRVCLLQLLAEQAADIGPDRFLKRLFIELRHDLLFRSHT